MLCILLCCAVSEQLSAQHGAVKMLHSRIRLLLDYLKSIQSGESVWYGVVGHKSSCVSVVYTCIIDEVSLQPECCQCRRFMLS